MNERRRNLYGGGENRAMRNLIKGTNQILVRA
jgi:hypothetical protein